VNKSAIFVALLISFLSGVPAHAQEPRNTAKAAALFRNAFDRLQNKEYAAARAGFEEGLKLNNRDVHAWLYYDQALNALYLARFLHTGHGDPYLEAVLQAQRKVDQRVRELKPSEDQLNTILVQFYGIYRTKFDRRYDVFRVNDVRGKLVCFYGAPRPYVREYLESMATIRYLNGSEHISSLNSLDGLCDLGLNSRLDPEELRNIPLQ